jgi:outer membrane protein OmpA-like peptidoglycan-associated protein
MKLWKNVILAWILFCFLAGCATNRAKRDVIVPLPDPDGRDMIVLLPDPDGRVGVLNVKTKGGSQILDKPGYATQVEDPSKPPIVPKTVDEKEIEGVFGPALSAQPDPTGRFVLFILYFESDTTKLTNESKELLPEVVRTIKTRKSNEVYVVGHTDRVGTEAYNIKLSSRRAYYIRDLLVFRGIKSSALIVLFHGEAMPLVYTEDEVAEPRNRRVEVFVR